MNVRKAVWKRRRITLHSLRRYVKTVVSDQVNSDYSEFFIGHSHSPYWTKKQSEKREIYGNKIMPYLTFLDYSRLEATGKSVEARLASKDREIADLLQDNQENKDAYLQLADMYRELNERLDRMEIQRQEK